VVNRNRLPRWVNRTIDAIADRPMSALGRLAARRFGRPVPAGTVEVTRFAPLPKRVLVAPVNYSGQATAWARALEQADPAISARSMAVDVPGGFDFAADLVVPVATFHNDRDWQRRQFEAASNATHVLIEAAEPLFGRLLGRSVAAQSQELGRLGVDVAFLAHGTDVRLPSRHIARHHLSHYADPSIYVPRAEQLARRNIALLEASGRPLFVSTPDLLIDLPTARWCPVVVDPSRWALPRGPRVSPLRVIHTPSVGTVKGTALILPALERLAAEGVIDLTLVQGVASQRMPAIMADADVLVDQFRIGSYGVAACEAMAAGCVVVSHVTEEVRTHVQKIARRPLPIVEATTESLEHVLRGLVDDTDLDALRVSSAEFVETVHDGRLAARALRDHWIDAALDPVRGDN